MATFQLPTMLNNLFFSRSIVIKKINALLYNNQLSTTAIADAIGYFRYIKIQHDKKTKKENE